MRKSSLIASSVACAFAVSLAACSAEPEPATSSEESAQTSVYSCRAKREAAASGAHGREAQQHWRHLLLGVMQPVVGVPSIRERLDLAPEEDVGLGRRLDAFAFARRAAGSDGLLSIERIVDFEKKTRGVTLALDAFQTDGSYSGDTSAIRGDALTDLRLTLYLVKHVFAIAEIGVTEGDVAVEAERQRQAQDAWQTVSLPITASDGFSSLDQLVAVSLSGQGPFCSTPAGNGLKALARAADLKFGGDDRTSMSEMAIFFSNKHDATITLDPWKVEYGPGGKTGDAWQDEWGLECALQLLRVAGRERMGMASPASPGVVLGVTKCDSIDLLAHQGSGTTFTGSTATARMGEKQYDIVMMKASLLQPKIRQILCLEPGNDLKLYVPYGEHVVSECAMVNGVYTAKHYGLTGFGYTDNWAAE